MKRGRPRKTSLAAVQARPFRPREGRWGAKTERIFREAIRATLRPRDRKPVSQWYGENIVVPLLVGSTRPGPLNMELMPQWKPLLEIAFRPRVRQFDLCKATRIGGTLMFGIGPILYNLAELHLPALWIDPTRKTAIRFSRQELQPHIKDCLATNRLRISTKTHWTAMEMIFKNGTLGVLGAGSVADLGGRQAGMIVINEQDKIPNKHRAEATPKLLAKQRAKQFLKAGTAKIFGNSTPTVESGLTWGEFLAGSQRWCYVRPPCGCARQRLTFFAEPAEPKRWLRLDDEPQDKDRELFSKVIPAPDGRGWLCLGLPATGRFCWPDDCKDSRSKAWAVDAVAQRTEYECVYCQAKFGQQKLGAMLRTAQWWAHHPDAPEDHESAHHWGAYSPFEDWGYFSKKWLLAVGNAARIHDFFNSDLGLPYVATPTRITRKILELLQQASPRYERQYPQDEAAELRLSARPVCLTMHVDVQQENFWWSICAWLPDGTLYLVAWGDCSSFAEIRKIANRTWLFDHGEGVPAAARHEEFNVFLGIIDTGYKAKRQGGVYEFLHEEGGRWHGWKAGAYSLGRDKPIAEEKLTFNYPGKGAVDVPVIKANDFLAKEQLYRYTIKERRPPPLHLPIDLDDHLITQLTSEHLTKRKLPDGRMEDVWQVGDCEPHLGDTLKMCVGAFRPILVPPLLAQMRAKMDAARARLLAKMATV
jgi:phage terminase large subunit GpA-like protein